MYCCCNIWFNCRKLIGGPIGRRLIEEEKSFEHVVAEDDSLLIEDEKRHERTCKYVCNGSIQLILAIGIELFFHGC